MGKRGARRDKDYVYYYRCPDCSYVGIVVTDRYYSSCGLCRRRFGLRGRTMTKAEYEAIRGKTDVSD